MIKPPLSKHNPITAELDQQLAQAESSSAGPIASIASQYNIETSDRLFGLLLKFDFEASHIITCDPWKQKCGGVPRGAFILLKLDPDLIGQEERENANRLILARIVDEAPTPVDMQTQAMLFQAHKLQSVLDPLTKKDLQWSGLQASIIGTYYDVEKDDKKVIEFGNDVDSYFAAFCYVAYMPTPEHLEKLINAFVDPKHAVEIGHLRYTETLSPRQSIPVPIKINPQDLVGELQSAQRTANFGKTRFGKSNGTKINAQSIFVSELGVAQLFIDPSGEYTYINAQDKTSLFALNRDKSVRYALKQRVLSEEEKAIGLTQPAPLAINFYEYPDVGHQLIITLWSTVNQSVPPGYMRPVLDWDPTPLNQAPPKQQRSAYNHYWRTMGLYYAFLRKADFVPSANLTVPIDFRGPVKQQLASLPGVRLRGNEIDTEQPISVLPELWKRVYQLWTSPNKLALFPNSDTTGEPYFDDIENSFLQCLGQPGLTAHNYVRPLNVYHSATGSSIFREIVRHLTDGTSVFVDVAQANEMVVENLTRQICKELFYEQNRLFSEDPTKQRIVLVHFEEAHKLFRSDDKDLKSIYNILAKEGAKFNIAMAYSTQSISTVSPDLTKMTDNLFIAHLDDDREIKEVSRKYVFRDVAKDLERTQSKGFVRMYTRSHRFALPVQIHKFGPEWAQKLTKSK
jgi:hypothetical protein